MLYPSVSVRPCSPFPIDNLSIYSRNFFKFCIHIVIGDEWCGIVNGQNPSIFNGVTALFRIGKMVSGLLFLYCSQYLCMKLHRYVAHQRLHIVTKDGHSDLPSL